MKIKHNGGNKTEREKIAKSIALAKIQGQEVPNCNLNLPPGATESALRNLQNMKNDPKLASILSLKEDSSCSSLEDSQEWNQDPKISRSKSTPLIDELEQSSTELQLHSDEFNVFSDIEDTIWPATVIMYNSTAKFWDLA